MAHTRLDQGQPWVAEARNDGIGIGKIGKFMGVLNSRNVSAYESPEERRERKTGRRWE